MPIVATQTLQGGLIDDGEAPPIFVAAANGRTLSKTPQAIPGGLRELLKCDEIKGRGLLEKLARGVCRAIYASKTSGVNATIELAAPASAIIVNELALAIEEGPALVLPVRVKLENPLLGSECYIGSDSDPIDLELTSGASGALRGKLGEVSVRAEGGILVLSDNTLVDGTFSAPEATGCGGGFSSLLDPIVNSKLGLPATSGNTVILNGTLEQASVELVVESEDA